jgi:CRISPR-associated protein Cas1
MKLSAKVRNGDPENVEATAARFYFSSIIQEKKFIRQPQGIFPNAALDYGYAIIRAAMARALTGSGLLCVYGIHHHNKYNPYCLADDIMEPYRAFVNDEVFTSPLFLESTEITQEIKRRLLMLLTADVMINGMKRPLQNAMSYTTASLVRCFLKEQKEIDYPEFCQCQVNIQL